MALVSPYDFHVFEQHFPVLARTILFAVGMSAAYCMFAFGEVLIDMWKKKKEDDRTKRK